MQSTPAIKSVQFPHIAVSRKLVLVAAVLIAILAAVTVATSVLGSNASPAPTAGIAAVSQPNQVITRDPGPLFAAVESTSLYPIAGPGRTLAVAGSDNVITRYPGPLFAAVESTNLYPVAGPGRTLAVAGSDIVVTQYPGPLFAN